jgi:hypothetical protein
MTIITFDIASHIRDNWSEDIKESDVEVIAKLAVRLLDCTETWDQIDRCVSIARQQVETERSADP